MIKNKFNLPFRLKMKGFTLIELLIVISIISLLSSIAFYSMTEAKLRGEDTKNISQAREVQNSMEIYRSQNNSYPISASSVGLYREGSTEYENVMQELIDDGYISEVPSSSNGSSYYYEVKEDGTASFLTTLLSEKYSDLFLGCYLTPLNGDCSLDNNTETIQSCDSSNQCDDYVLTSVGSIITSGGGSSSSLCGASHNRAHDSYSYSEACSSEAATNGQINEMYNGTQQWIEWICIENNNTSNIETCETSPEPTTPTACGIGTTGAGGVDWFVGFNYALPSSNQVSSFASNSNDGVYRENTYCSVGVYSKGSSYSMGGGPRTYQWRCYTGSSSGIGDAGSYTSCQYTDN